MKWALLLVFSLFLSRSIAQSEFAATGFYDDFRKFYADARTGFTTYRGTLRDSSTAVPFREYHSLLILPLADSGKIVIPVKGTSYAEFIFEPARSRLKIDQRAMDLRDAILASVGIPLYCRTETFMVEERPMTNMWLFIDPGETRNSMAAFRISIYFSEGKYFISLVIKGQYAEP